MANREVVCGDEPSSRTTCSVRSLDRRSPVEADGPPLCPGAFRIVSNITTDMAAHQAPKSASAYPPWSSGQRRQWTSVRSRTLTATFAGPSTPWSAKGDREKSDWPSVLD